MKLRFQILKVFANVNDHIQVFVCGAAQLMLLVPQSFTKKLIFLRQPDVDLLMGINKLQKAILVFYKNTRDRVFNSFTAFQF